LPARPGRLARPAPLAPRTQVSASTAFTGFSSKTSYLKTKMAALEELLMQEKGKREQLEQDLKKLQATAEKPATPQATA